MILLVLVGSSSQPMNARFDYERLSCPMNIYLDICTLAKNNIKEAEDLKVTVDKLLEVVEGQGLDTSEVKIILDEAEKLLEQAKSMSNNCIASNYLALGCKELLKNCLEVLESIEEDPVYSALIKTLYPEGHIYIDDEMDHAPVRIYVIDDHTLHRGGVLDRDEILSELEDTEQETLDDFFINVEQDRSLSADLFHLDDVEVVLISGGEKEEIFGDKGMVEGWKEFYKLYPYSQGIMTLSRVGFNLERNQALVCVWNAYAPLAGELYYVLLVKKADVWVVQDTFLVAIS